MPLSKSYKRNQCAHKIRAHICYDESMRSGKRIWLMRCEIGICTTKQQQQQQYQRNIYRAHTKRK